MTNVLSNELHDPWLVREEDLPDSKQSKLDMFRRLQRSRICRIFGVSSFENSQGIFPVRRGHYLTGDAALCRDGEGLACHLYSGRGTFAGFAIAMCDGDRIVTRTRGVVLLPLEGVTPAHRGETVYATAPDAFNLSEGTRIGIVLHFEKPGFALVIFAPNGEVSQNDLQHIPGIHPHRKGLTERR
jgi:hypothetical protein